MAASVFISSSDESPEKDVRSTIKMHVLLWLVPFICVDVDVVDALAAASSATFNDAMVCSR